MPWWGWLIIIAVCIIATAIVVYVSLRKGSGAAHALAEAEREKAKAAAAKAEQEKATRIRVEQERNDLATKLKAINAWYAGAQQQISRERQSEYEKLAGDPTALDAELDRLLGAGTDDEPTNPG
jgi:uncharacterized protein HemX